MVRFGEKKVETSPPFFLLHHRSPIFFTPFEDAPFSRRTTSPTRILYTGISTVLKGIHPRAFNQLPSWASFGKP